MASLRLTCGAAVLAFTTVFSQVGCAAGSGTQTPLRSAGALEFGGDNVLFVGDSKAGVVHAFDLPDASFDDQSAVSLGRAQTFEGRSLIEDIDIALGQLFGKQPDEILTNDMIVHAPTKQIFISVHQGRGPDATPAIVKVNDGALEVLDLSTAEHTSIGIGEVPTTQTLEFGQLQNALAITDIDYFNGEIFVAGLSNGSFASKLRRAAYPFQEDVSETSIEIWHAVHAQFETRAPIIAQDIQVLDGTPTLIAVYACTPLVRIPLAELKDGAKIRGEMIGELGFGNTPVDMITYRDPMDGKDYVLVTNTNRSAKRVALSDIASVDPMPVNVPNNFGPDGVAQFPMPISDAMHLDMIDPQWAAIMRRSPHDLTRTELHTLPLPFFFDRADHIVEMNWPGAPDPFGYRKAAGDEE